MTLQVGSRDRAWDLFFFEVFEVQGYRYHRDVKGFQGADRTMCKGMGSWCGQVQACPLPCVQHSSERQHQVALEWSHDQQSTCLGSEYTTYHLQASREAGRNMGGLQNRDSIISAKKLEDDGSTVTDRKNVNKIWTTRPFTKVMSQRRWLFAPFWC